MRLPPPPNPHPPPTLFFFRPRSWLMTWVLVMELPVPPLEPVMAPAQEGGGRGAPLSMEGAAKQEGAMRRL